MPSDSVWRMGTGFLHGGDRGSPMVLIHGFSGTSATWTPLLPALKQRHDVLALALLGHRGGPEFVAGSPATPSAMADALERNMDAVGVARAHLVGHSLGGWLALELAARGRALSTTALAPAGGWTPGGSEARRLGRMFRSNDWVAQALGPDRARRMRRRRFRAVGMRLVAVRPADVPAGLAVEMMEAAADCPICWPLLAHLDDLHPSRGKAGSTNMTPLLKTVCRARATPHLRGLYGESSVPTGGVSRRRRAGR